VGRDCISLWWTAGPGIGADDIQDAAQIMAAPESGPGSSNISTEASSLVRIKF